MKKLTPFAKLLIVMAIVGTIFFSVRYLMSSGLIPTPGVMQALVPEKAVLPELKDSQVTGVERLPAPESAPADVKTTLIRGAIWAWNAQQGLIFANGGARTTKGSLMEKYGVNLQLYRQDDTVKMQEELISCAKEIQGGAKQCTTGANFVIIMGDGAGQFAAGVNPQLEKLGPEYKLAVIGSVGYSRGEDSFMAPPKVKLNPQAAKGLLVAGVLRDGDWNIAMKWAADNDIKNNPDEKTYDEDAINWISSTDYIAAAADYVAGKCEERKVIKKGVVTGETKKVCIDAIVTWTPGDVTAVQKRGGLVRIASSKEYRSQMPSTIIGSRAFFEANRKEITGMLAGAFQGADQIKAHDDNHRKASELAAKVFGEQTGEYWYKYFKGAVETDREGNKVEVGGSAVNNLADNLILFGLMPGTNDNFRATYTTFANIAVQQYPDLFKDTPIPSAKDIVDKSFITGAQAIASEPGAVADTPVFTGKAPEKVVSSRNYSINFQTGKALLTPEGVRQLDQLKDSIAITGLFVKIDGHTDNTGDEAKTNLPLSTARAEAVKAYLQKQAPENFPDTRFSVEGHGSSSPLQPNTTAAGKAANRRVQITLLDN